MIDLEQRLARYGDAIDELTPEDAWHDEGSTMPHLVETIRPRRRPVVALAAAMVVLVLLVTALLVARTAGPDVSPARPAPPTWERQSLRAAGFRPSQSPSCCTRLGDLLVAYGDVHAGRGEPGEPRSRAAIWTSPDGSTWTRARVEGSAQREIGSVARIAGHAIAFSRDASGTYWTSADGRRWRSAVSPSLAGFTVRKVVAAGDRLVLFDVPVAPTPSQPDPRIRVLASDDGRTWTALPDLPFGVSGSDRVMIEAFRGGLLALQPSDPFGGGPPQVWTSADGASWTLVASNLPRGAFLFVPAKRRYAFVSVSDQQWGPGGHLWRSADGATWKEVTSFHETFPTATLPFDMGRAGGWWIVGAFTTTDGKRRTDLFWSRDLEHWADLPERLRAPNVNAGLVVTVGRRAVVVRSAGALLRWPRG